MGVQKLLQPVQPDLKLRNVRLPHPQGHPGGFCEDLVLHKVGGDGQKLSSRHRQRPEHCRQGRRGAAGQKQILRPRSRGKPAVQVPGNRRAGLKITNGGGITVKGQGIQLAQQ